MGRKEVSVSDMMNAREARFFTQRKLLADYPGSALVCLTLNIAGSVKTGKNICSFFRKAVTLVNGLIPDGECLFHCESYPFTGPEAMWSVSSSPRLLKERTIKLEDRCAAMRLLDVDVIGSDGQKLSREDMGAPRRKCLLCGNDAVLCARSRTHSAQQLFREANRLIDNYLADDFAAYAAMVAEQALLTEVAVSPKPGLVDRIDSGSHKDMDIFTFINSACSLRDYFRECVEIGLSFRGESPELCFRNLRFSGILAESSMMTATGNVNTHKGAIFSMGIFCAALGMVFDGCSSNPESALLMSGSMTAADMTIEMPDMSGIRYEAAHGFPTVRNFSLPCFSEMMTKGASINDSCLVTLVKLMSITYDTNVLRRGGEKGLAYVKASAEKLNKEIMDGEVDSACLYERMKKTNEEFVKRNLSPGGCADLLAVTIAAYRISENEKDGSDDI